MAGYADANRPDYFRAIFSNLLISLSRFSRDNLAIQNTPLS
jgi:hypothetical protein